MIHPPPDSCHKNAIKSRRIFSTVKGPAPEDLSEFADTHPFLAALQEGAGRARKLT
jgi:hypothetical protein